MGTMWTAIAHLTPRPGVDWLPEGADGADVRVVVVADGPAEAAEVVGAHLGPLVAVRSVEDVEAVNGAVDPDSELHDLVVQLGSVPRDLVFGVLNTDQGVDELREGHDGQPG